MTKQEKYSTYSFEDFLQDNFFIESIKRPTEESLLFWNRFLEDYPEQSETYHAAQMFLEDLMRPQISNQEVNDIRENIRMNIESTVQKGKIRKIIYYSTAVAASIAILMLSSIFFFQKNGDRDDIMAYVINNVDSISDSKDIRLMLSEEKTLVLQGAEPVINYDSAGILTNSEKISKDDIASYNKLIVPHGKRSVLSLHDGTKIWVNSGTTIVYPVEFDKNQREIYVNGEIFLAVAHDAGRPFTVRTNDLRIQVLGTRFNVQAYSSDEQSTVALESGLVKISSGKSADGVLLKPNKIYEQNKAGHSSVKDADIGKYTSWIYGMYTYESEHLGVILKRLERYYGKEIVAGASVSGLKCSGDLDLKENIEDVLSVISRTAPVKYINDGEKYIINYQPK